MSNSDNPVDPIAFRNCLGCFATGITIITTIGPEGELIGNTASSFNSVSLDPPLILWSLGQQAHSLKAYMSADHFAVNVLRKGQEHLSNQFAKPQGNKWEAIDYEQGITGCPILPTSLAVFECKVANTYRGGDHIIFVGEVVNFDFDPKGTPLLFYRGKYREIGEGV